MSRNRTRLTDEEAPLLNNDDSDSMIVVNYENTAGDPHKQFCLLIGIPPSDLPPNQKPPPSSENKLYERARRKRKSQNLIYQCTAALTNLLLLSQVILGATLTALGASSSSHVLITIFGVFNTVIAGLVAYLKSRGQPMRARLFLDDLDHVVAEIENSEIMWLGIARSAHGYDEIDIGDTVSVRSEVARLTRLFDKAVKSNTQNNPDIAGQLGGGSDALTGLRARPPGEVPGATMNLAAVPAPEAPAPEAPADEDEAPATKRDRTKGDEDETPASKPAKPKTASESVKSPTKDSGASESKAAAPSPAANAAKEDPDEAGPASAKDPSTETEDKAKENGEASGGPKA